MTDEERARRAWDAMRRSHLRSAKLRVREDELQLEAAKAQLAAAKAERASWEEHERGGRAYHLAESFSQKDPAVRAQHAARAAEKRTPPGDHHLEWLEGQIPKLEADLTKSRAEYAAQLAEHRAEREHEKALRVIFGSRAAARSRTA